MKEFLIPARPAKTSVLFGVVLGLGVSLCTVARGQDVVNLALNKPFNCTAPSRAGWNGLVDGVKSSDQKPGCFATDGSDKMPKAVIIDLGATYKIEQIDVLNSLNGNTRAVSLACSIDGRQWTKLREYVFPDRQLQQLSHKFPPTDARYVRITFLDTYGGGFGGDCFMFLREVEVYGICKQTSGTPTVEQPASPTASLFTSSRELKIFTRYAFREGTKLKLAVLGDRIALPPNEGEQGMGETLAKLITEAHKDVKVDVLQFSKEALTAEDALDIVPDIVKADPDLCVIALGTTDSLNWHATAFRNAVSDLLTQLRRDTQAVLIIVTPPPFAHNPDEGLAEEIAGKDTAGAVSALRGAAALLDIPMVDGGASLRNAGIDEALLYADNVKLSELGQTVIARTIMELLK